MQKKLYTTNNPQPNRGDVFIARLDSGCGSEQWGMRPVLIIQNNIGNFFSPTVICAVITSSQGKRKLPTHIHINHKRYPLRKDSIVLLEQLHTIDKNRLYNWVCRLDKKHMERIENGLIVSLGMQGFRGELATVTPTII
ncbi:MAG: type II toxin-antitoxin system PemK/MazF family toxin [Defluviitaleaceae bacterium]|nr:type II toxin-antitoxin system PemK/MazF family toxin [Defluviitaleaceae bacterium]